MSRVRRGPWAAGMAGTPAAAMSDPSKPRLTTSAMIASLVSEGQRSSTAPFGHALVEAARNRPDIVGMTADLGKYTDLHIFGAEYPDRYYQMGMAEQNMMLAAAGARDLQPGRHVELPPVGGAPDLPRPGVARPLAARRRATSGPSL